MKIAQWHLDEASFSEEDLQDFDSPWNDDVADLFAGWDEIESNLSEVDYIEQFENALIYGDGDLPW